MIIKLIFEFQFISEMNGMLNEKMFGPIEVPILKGVGRREITTFLAQYERYEAVRDSRTLMGVELQLIPKVNCVEPHLLNSRHP